MHRMYQNTAVPDANMHGNNPIFNAPPRPPSFPLPQQTPALGYQGEANQYEMSTARPHSRDNFGFSMGPSIHNSTLPVNTGWGSFPQEASAHASSSHVNQHQGFNFNHQPTSAFTQQSAHTSITAQQPHSMPLLTTPQVQMPPIAPQPETTQRVRQTIVSILCITLKT
jgi:hypothetical protein